MDIIEGLRSRRSTKGYSAKPVSRDTILGMVDAARFSPSGGGKNAWKFVIVTERDKIARLSQASPYCKWLASAQAAIAVVIDPKATRYWLEDCSVAAFAISIAALDMGLGTAWAALHQAGDDAEGQRRQGIVREVLGIPANLNVPMMLGVGYAEKQPGPKTVPRLADIVCWERYTL